MPAPKGIKVNPYNLKQWMVDEDLTRTQLAIELDMGINSINKWCRGVQGMSPGSIAIWKARFGFCPIEKFGVMEKPNKIVDRVEVRLLFVNGRIFRIWREEKKLTLTQFANILGTTASVVSEWELEKKGMSVMFRQRFKAEFDFDPCRVFEHETTTAEDLFHVIEKAIPEKVIQQNRQLIEKRQEEEERKKNVFNTRDELEKQKNQPKKPATDTGLSLNERVKKRRPKNDVTTPVKPAGFNTLRELERQKQAANQPENPHSIEGKTELGA